MKKNPYEKIIEKNCSICGKILLVDQYGNGECPFCKWYNTIDDGENTEMVIFPNVVSENKAKKLFLEGKPIRPDLDDFLEMFYFYSEVEFWYKNKNYCLLFTDDDKIKFGWNSESITYYKDKEDFIKNAKIDNEYVRDIWDNVENPKYM